MNWRPLIAAAVLAAALVIAGASAAASRPLQTAFTDTFVGMESFDLGLRRMRAGGTSIVRMTVSWAAIAPVPPAAGTDARDPSNPMYRWSALDAKVTRAAAAGLDPLVVISDSPHWARQRDEDAARFRILRG